MTRKLKLEDRERKIRASKTRRKKRHPAFADKPPTDQERDKVEIMIACGFELEEIAKVMRGGVAVSTLWRHFRDELETGRIKVNAAVIGTLFKRAVIDEEISALIYWTKARLGWRETNVVEHKQIGKISTEIMSPEQWQAQFAENADGKEKIH